MRFLVLTAAFGDGHNTAAHNVSQALSQCTEVLACPVRDPIAEANPLTASALQSGYQLAITTLPKIWRFLYRTTESVNLNEPPVEVFNGVLDWLEAEIKRLAPVGIVSTYPLYSTLIRQIDPGFPIYTVITDSITVHRSWTTTPSNLHFVTDERSSTVVQSYGIPHDTIRVCGFPVAPALAQLTRSERTCLKRLLWICSTGTRHSVSTFRSLLQHLPQEITLTVVLGRHGNRLSGPLERVADECDHLCRVKFVGWCEDMPRLLSTHDLVITKAGGATTHECLAAGIPMGINYVVPGQEEGNAELALSSGSAIRIERPENTGAQIRKLIGTEEFRSLARNTIRCGVSDGACRIAREIVSNHSRR